MKFFRHGGAIASLLVVGILLAIALSVKLLADTAELRYERDVNRMVYSDNLGLLERLRARSGIESDSVRKLLEDSTAAANAPYIVVSITDHRLWLKQGDSVLFTAPVATASGKELVGSGPDQQWRFNTPRGRLVVQSKDSAPMWVPPEWHYIEQARKHDVGLVHLQRGQTITGSDGSRYSVEGSDIVRTYPGGRTVPLGPPKEGQELIVGGNLIVPPFGTDQRRYPNVLGTRRLDLGDGYGIHGTDEPSSIGHSVSHGCVRMYNSDVEKLYPMVPVGTPVYIY